MTIRVRLAFLFTILFALAGAALLTINYVLVRDRLPAHHISTITANDVINRAGKLLNVQKVPADQQKILRDIATATPSQVSLLIRNHPDIPPGLAKLLFSELPNSTRADALHQLLVQSSIALAVMLAVSALLGWVAAGRAVKPLQTITHAAQQISATNLDERIALQGPDDEVKQLADTFDELLDRLDTAFSNQRLFIANASHELSTPLSIMRTELDVTVRRPDADIGDFRAMSQILRDTLDRCDALLVGLITLAEADRGLTTLAAVNLADVIRDAIARHATAIATRALDVQLELAPTEVRGDKTLLERAADNLIDNAIVHNHDHGWMRIVTTRNGERVDLEVTNSGAEVAADQAALLFEPFNRAQTRTHAKARGVGLGLTLVRAVATAHGGGAQVHPQPGGGLSVAVSLPIGKDQIE